MQIVLLNFPNHPKTLILNIINILVLETMKVRYLAQCLAWRKHLVNISGMTGEKNIPVKCAVQLQPWIYSKEK